MWDHGTERGASMQVAGLRIAIRTVDGNRRTSAALGSAAAVVAALLLPQAVTAEAVNGVVTMAEPATGTRSIELDVTSRHLYVCTLPTGGEAPVLAFPNGRCRTGPFGGVLVTYRNTGLFDCGRLTPCTDGHVFVNGGPATGDAGGTWSLTTDDSPGPDQYSARVVASQPVQLTDQPSCDFGWSEGGSCLAEDGDSAEHELQMHGPESTDFMDDVWTIPYVFTAVP